MAFSALDHEKILRARHIQRGRVALSAANMASLPLALAGGRDEAPTFPHPLPESFPLLRGHVLTALGHALGRATADIGAIETMTSKSAEEDPAQQQKPKPLPEGDLAP